MSLSRRFFLGKGLVFGAAVTTAAVIGNAIRQDTPECQPPDALRIEAQQREQAILDQKHKILTEGGAEQYTLITSPMNLNIYHFGDAIDFLPTPQEIDRAIQMLQNIFANANKDKKKENLLPPRLMLLLCTSRTQENSQTFARDNTLSTRFAGFVRRGLKNPSGKNDIPSTESQMRLSKVQDTSFTVAPSCFINDQENRYILSDGSTRISDTRASIVIPPSLFNYSGPNPETIALGLGYNTYSFPDLQKYYLFMTIDAVVICSNRYSAIRDLDPQELDNLEVSLWHHIAVNICDASLIISEQSPSSPLPTPSPSTVTG